MLRAGMKVRLTSTVEVERVADEFAFGCMLPLKVGDAGTIFHDEEESGLAVCQFDSCRLYVDSSMVEEI